MLCYCTRWTNVHVKAVVSLTFPRREVNDKRVPRQDFSLTILRTFGQFPDISLTAVKPTFPGFPGTWSPCEHSSSVSSASTLSSRSYPHHSQVNSCFLSTDLLFAVTMTCLCVFLDGFCLCLINVLSVCLSTDVLCRLNGYHCSGASIPLNN